MGPAHAADGWWLCRKFLWGLALLWWHQSEGHCACVAWLSAALAASIHSSLMKHFESHCQVLNAPGRETVSLCTGFSLSDSCCASFSFPVLEAELRGLARFQQSSLTF